MPDVENSIRSLRKHKKAIKGKAVKGSLVLVDLIDSTAYKTKNGEGEWLTRLVAFQDAVKSALGPLKPTKFLGDGILGFYKPSEIAPAKLREKAEKILEEIRQLNSAEAYRGDHIVHVRVVLGYGEVFLFEGKDPQGTAVDKVFRIEKYVPADCIGMVQEFVDVAKPTQAEPVGRYHLKGLAEGRHQLYILGSVDDKANVVLNLARKRAALYDIWDLGLAGEGKIYLISGHIPPEEKQPATIQIGDNQAVIQAYKNLARVGRLENVEVLTSLNVHEEYLKENVVCIGGPYWNNVTLRFMQEIKSPFIFDFGAPDDRTPIVNCLNSEQYEATRSGDRLTRDAGFLGRFPNPMNPERHVILACGIESPSVAGIIEAFSENQSHFLKLHDAILSAGQPKGAPRNDIPPFFARMEFKVEYNGNVHMPTAEGQVSNILIDWLRDHNGKLQEGPPE